MNYFPKQLKQQIAAQIHLVKDHLNCGDISVADLGAILPASVMVHDLENSQPVVVSYMNNWGCERLGTSKEEVNILGSHYYEKYFVAEEAELIFNGLGNYLSQGDFDKNYNCFQRVKLYRVEDYKWFYTLCKVVKVKEVGGQADKLIVISSPIDGVDQLSFKIRKVLDENIFIKYNFEIFATLTRREKSIISLVANGLSSQQIADKLFISIHTVNTHRKNIILKTDCRSFAKLLKFAIAFNLV